MKKIQKIVIGSGGMLLPFIALAQGGDLGGILTTVQTLINRIIPVLVAVGVVVFLWGLIQFISAAGDEEKRTNGRQLMIWGLVGLAIMVGIWGLVNVILQTFGVSAGGTITPPTVQFR